MSGVAPEKQGWLVPTLIVVALISAFRIVLLAFSRADLNVDEVQYWLWGQELAFGYYSKPPMIGWVIGLVTEVAGSDAPFWVRVPAVLFHAATAVILGAIAARHFGDKPAVLTALCYIVLPMVSVGSLLISTDTIMFPFLALALAGYLRLLEDRAVSTALFTGAALGLAFMSKYAAIYYLFTAVLSAFFVKQARLDARSILLIGVAFLVTISPNIAWNILNGFLTISHTMDNADWVRAPGGRASFNVAGMAEFFITQFAFFGPILFGALLLLALYAWRGRLSPIQRILLIFSLPIVALLCGQALLSRANPNWAAAAYIAGTLITVPWLMGRHRLWLILTFAIGGSLTVALPLSNLSADNFSLTGKSLS
jgi:4-amino-4-deoxy-L-arabinose transferase-like glycosyltransferase